MDYEDFVLGVSPHVRAMTHVAEALVGQTDAEDAAQEALVRAWRAWGDLRDAGAVRAWLLRITVNVCRNWQAGRYGTHRRLTEPLSEANQDDTDAALIRAGPGTPGHTAALDLRRAVTHLPHDLRQIIALRFYAGMDATEIGLALETSPATVRTRLRRALQLLRDRLSVDDDDAHDAGIRMERR
jgi:RNA polymerase sigma-70 factor (ECF subfamily)